MEALSARDKEALYEGGTLGETIISAIRRNPERVAFIAGDSQLTYREMGERIARAIAMFDTLGLRPGDAVAQLSGNRPELFCIVAAAYIHGLRSVTLHAAASVSDHAHILRDSQAKLFITEDYHAKSAAELKAIAGEALCWFSHDGNGEIRNFWTEAEALDPGNLAVRSASDRVIRLAYTGGTTGKSKGVMLTDRSLLTNTLLWLSAFAWPDHVRYLCVAPMSHGAGSLILPVLMRGGTIVLHRGFDAGRILADIERHDIDVTWLVPTMLYGLLDHEDTAKVELSSLKAVVYSGAPASPTRIAQALDVFGPVMVQAYGQTEAPNTILILDQRDHSDASSGRLHSAGRPAPGLQVALLDDEGREVGQGDVGEICVRGPLVMDGYWNQPEQTEETLRGGWLHTGDLAHRDEDGFYYIVDRKKDMVISGGFNVYPREIEDVLSAHPDVAAVAVIGIPDAKWGEAVTAVVVPHAGRDPKAEDLMDLVRERKGPVHTPKTVVFVETLPLTSLGKTDKKALRQRFSATPAPSLPRS